MVKNLPANVGDARDMGLISGSGGSLGEGNGNPPQYFCLENDMDRGAWWAIICGVAMSWIQLSTHTQFLDVTHDLGGIRESESQQITLINI